jgi:hypothetical protein
MPVSPLRAKQSTNTTGTGTIVLNAADANARNFQTAFGAGSRRIMYAISWATGFEIGFGDYDGGFPGSLTRATVLKSSNSDALVALPGGTKDVFPVVDPAAREVLALYHNLTLSLADLNNTAVLTGVFASTVFLPALASVPQGSGWTMINSASAALTIDPNGAELVNGASTLVLSPGQSAILFRVGSEWQAAIQGYVAPQAEMRNLIINGNPIINQRNYVSGTPTTGAYQYTLDRWQVVNSGATLSWTDSGGIRTALAPASGGVQQVIEGINNHGGWHTFSWVGNASATINGVSILNGGRVFLTGGADIYVGLISGTFGLVQLERGLLASPFGFRHFSAELALCQRYFFVLGHDIPIAFNASAASANSFLPVRFPVRMRVAPTAAPAWGASSNASSFTVNRVTADGGTLELVATAAGYSNVTLSASTSFNGEF